MEDYSKRIDLADRNAKAIKDGLKRMDLAIMSDHCRDLIREVSKEAVNCRRIHKATPKYEEVLKQLEEAVGNYESHVIYAKLSDH